MHQNTSCARISNGAQCGSRWRYSTRELLREQSRTEMTQAGTKPITRAGAQPHRDHLGETQTDHWIGRKTAPRLGGSKKKKTNPLGRRKITHREVWQVQKEEPHRENVGCEQNRPSWASRAASSKKKTPSANGEPCARWTAPGIAATRMPLWMPFGDALSATEQPFALG